jgi:hypothetical protein
MSFFSFFRTPKPQRFEYKPRFYDPDKERLKDILDNAGQEGKSSSDLAKARISSAFRERRPGKSSYSRRMTNRSNLILVAVVIILFILTFILLTVYLPRFIQLFEG